jgi:hypothetical protein
VRRLTHEDSSIDEYFGVFGIQSTSASSLQSCIALEPAVFENERGIFSVQGSTVFMIPEILDPQSIQGDAFEVFESEYATDSPN